MDELATTIAGLLKEWAPVIIYFYIAAYAVFGLIFVAVFAFILRQFYKMSKSFDKFDNDFNKRKF